LDSLREKGSLQKGIRLDKGKGMIKVMTYDNVTHKLPPDLTAGIADHMIIETALTVLADSPKSRKVILVSRDVNLRVIADSVGMLAEDYLVSQVVKDTEQLYSGMATVLVDDELIDQFYDGERIFISKELISEQKLVLYPNIYLMLVSCSNEKKTALCRFSNYDNPVRRTLDCKNKLNWGVQPRNKEQTFAFDLLMDPSVHLVTLTGQAGSGKTLCAIAAGMEQAISFGRMYGKASDYNEYDHMKYDTPTEDNMEFTKMVVSRPVQPMGRDIGFLPGTMEEKMLPWLKPIQDNIQFIMGNDKLALQQLMESGAVELEALTYIRGRSISNSFIIVDEAQNLTAHEVKTIITRAGEGTKIVLTGDIEQIDNVYTNETSNGLTYAIEKFKDSTIAGHVSFKKGERSRLATEAAKIL
jgi:PhoH-like ATPase